MKWINIKEQLPLLNTDVLVIVEEPQNRYASYDSRMKVARMYERMLSEYHETEESKKDILRWTTTDTVLYWMPLPDQPERSKREDLKCKNCKGIPFVFNCCWGDPRHLGNENCDEYNFRMRCSEHCGNTVREVQ